jgi:hypothetical protein
LLRGVDEEERELEDLGDWIWNEEDEGDGRF